MDRLVTVRPTFLGAAHKHLEQNSGDEAGAVAYAERVIRLTQAAGGVKDLAAMQRGSEPMKLLTIFYSYFSAMYNRLRTLGRDVWTMETGDFPALLARALFLVIVPAVMGEMLVGRGPDDDDDWTAWVLTKVLVAPFMSVPVVRDIASGASSSYGYTLSPATHVGETMVRMFGEIGDLANDLDVPMLAQDRRNDRLRPGPAHRPADRHGAFAVAMVR